VLVMGFVPPSELVDLDRDVHLLVSVPAAMDWIRDYRDRSGVDLPVHLKVNTGTNRQGVALPEVGELCDAAIARGLNVVGVATHFANIEDTVEHEFARTQLERFESAVEDVAERLGGRPPYVHAACSAAALLFRATDFTVARVGISMYGHWPSRETKLSWMLEHGRDGLPLRPAMTWKSVVGQTVEVARGETVGYGRTWTALRRTRLAVVPVGYADGFPRALGNRARVLVRGAPAPVVGRVCMNIFMADVTDVPEVRVGDEVVLLGAQGGSQVSAEELAGHADTINYELLARVSPDIPRTLVHRG
jgi:alanine racemase